MRRFTILIALLVVAPILASSGDASAQVGVSFDVGIAPPAPRQVAPEARYGYDGWDSWDGYSYGGYVWVQGRWAWDGYSYRWMDGYWTQARPGFVWVDGYWSRGPRNRYH